MYLFGYENVDSSIVPPCLVSRLWLGLDSFQQWCKLDQILKTKTKTAAYKTKTTGIKQTKGTSQI